MKPNVLMIVLPYIDSDACENYVGRKRSFVAFPYGVLSIATYCKDVGDFQIIDCNTFRSQEEYLRAIHNKMMVWKPHVVGISMMFDYSERYLQGILDVVTPDCGTIVVGGASASCGYSYLLEKYPQIGSILVGEGEQPFYDFLTYVRYRCDGIGEPPPFNEAFVTCKVIADGDHPVPHYLEDMDRAIDLDYSLIDDVDAYGMEEAFSPHVKSGRSGRQFFLVTSRGCPFRCRFCSNGALHGRKMRYASVDAIIAHVDKLVTQYKMSTLTIYDDQLLLNRERARELFRRLIPYKLRIECPNGLSVAYIDNEIAGLMRQAGMDTIYLAIEHGSPYVLKHIIRKPLRVEKVKPVVEILRKHGFYIHGFFVMGMPGETPVDRDLTLDLLLDIGLDWAGFNAARPVKGSELYDQCLEKGWIEPQGLGGEVLDRRYIIDAPEIGLTQEIIEEELYRMNLEINFVRNNRLLTGDYATAERAFKQVLKRDPDHAFALLGVAEARHRAGIEDESFYEQAVEAICCNTQWKEYYREFYGLFLGMGWEKIPEEEE